MQVDRKNYNKVLSFSCVTKTSPNPTTGVAELGLRLDLASMRMLARSLNILGWILLLSGNVSILLTEKVPVWSN
jgi:hypothetical protein